ncbi:ricin-type beta-trefoil lectin domain protein [Streptomyces sp. NBC_00853]|uniref:ricin-type beta-trefoil lectin domain protein n=1 Tax=Streptomyces sp. NBC_00853 TaxID=2903681 RepID=UPI00387356F1|nr:ricin-type beta-trefoil lectin domain protein [Streptomyces sp. NBC_00853]
MIALLASMALVFGLSGSANADASGQTNWGAFCIGGKCFYGGVLRVDVTGRGGQVYTIKGSFGSHGISNWKFRYDFWDLNNSNYRSVEGGLHSSTNASGSASWNPDPFPARIGKACVSLYSNAQRLATACISITAANVVLRSSYNGRCLDADLNTMGRNGTKVQLWNCNGQPQQGWVLDGGGAIRSIRDRSRCLDADLNTIQANGTKVQLWDCNGQPQQVWRVSSTGWIYNEKSGRCLDADLNTIQANGTKVQLWDCNGQRQQNWY